MAVRAKFRCMSVTERFTQPEKPYQWDVRLLPVMYRKDGTYDPGAENKTFWDATPAGEISLTITNPAAAKAFRPGQAYYIDFVEAGD